MEGAATYRRWRAQRVWLRNPARALALLAPDAQAGEAGEAGDPEALSLYAWLALTYRRDEAEAERAARLALRRAGDRSLATPRVARLSPRRSRDGRFASAARAGRLSPRRSRDGRFASAALAAVLLNRGAYDEALDVLRAAQGRHPDVPWYALSISDALVEAGRAVEAGPLLEQAAASGPPLRRHALKRLSQLALARGDLDAARRWFGELLSLAPDYLVYASDYVTAGRLALQADDLGEAEAIWRRGAAIYPRNDELRELLVRHFDDAGPRGDPNIEAVSEQAVGAQRIPVRTPFITARTGLVGLVDEATAGVREPGDVLVLAESAAAAGQGRIVPLELVVAEPMAGLLSRFVGKIGPLHSAEGMEGAIMEAGRPRVAAAALAGAVGKLAGRRGWFYRVAGPATAMIDDVAAAMPPHDHHILFGPRDPDGLAAELRDALSCEAAIVDANHLTGAWVVGATPGVERAWLTAALADNPAGNEDEGTPVVLVRRLGTGALSAR